MRDVRAAVAYRIPDQERGDFAATVTYRHGTASAPEGMLTPGDAIPLADGLRVNANVTYAS